MSAMTSPHMNIDSKVDSYIQPGIRSVFLNWCSAGLALTFRFHYLTALRNLTGKWGFPGRSLLKVLREPYGLRTTGFELLELLEHSSKT